MKKGFRRISNNYLSCRLQVDFEIIKKLNIVSIIFKNSKRGAAK